MAELGEAFVTVRASTKQFPGDVKKGLEQASKDAEKLLDDIGEVWGDKLADSTSNELKKHGKDFGDAVEKSVEKVTVKVRPKIDYHNVRNSKGQFAKLGSNIEQEIEEAFTRAGRPGGPVTSFVQGFRDAIGSVFNISGKSPLVGALVPVFGALIGLVLAAVQAVNALVAVLTVVPGLIAAIGIQAGVLFLAFKGIGSAVQGAFAAKNTKELNEAIKGLTPPAQAFVKSLLPLKPLFKQLQTVTQSNFFTALGDVVTGIRVALGPEVLKGFGRVATQLGLFFRQFGMFLSSKTFVSFVRDVFPATANFIGRFGPAFIKFLEALIRMADVAMPFLRDLGVLVSNSLTSWANTIQALVGNGGDFKVWLAQMMQTLVSVGEVVGQAVQLITVLMVQLNRAGGATILDTIADALEQLSMFFASPVGLKAMEGFVDIAKFMIMSLAGLVIAVGLVVAVLEILGESLHEFWRFVVQVLVPGVVGGFAWLGKSITDHVQSAIQLVLDIPDRIRRGLSGINSVLYNAGRNLIHGFIDGIRSMFGSLGNVVHEAMNIVGRFVPGSPAKEGPLSGQGYVYYRGQRMVKDFGEGITSGFGDLRMGLGSDLGAMVSALAPQAAPGAGTTFAAGAVKLTFEGALPTEQQAYGIGKAAMAGMGDQLAKRDTRLAVRTL